MSFLGYKAPLFLRGMEYEVRDSYRERKGKKIVVWTEKNGPNQWEPGVNSCEWKSTLPLVLLKGLWPLPERGIWKKTSKKKEG